MKIVYWATVKREQAYFVFPGINSLRNTQDIFPSESFLIVPYLLKVQYTCGIGGGGN